jgi:CubicO group peptidase (beta-lactamase class C family)
MIVLQCVERGELSLDEDINVYLSRDMNNQKTNNKICNPNFPEIPITIRHLLQHKSSLQDTEAALCEGSKWRVDRNQDCPITLQDYVYRRLCPPAAEESLASNVDYEPYAWNKRQGPGEARYHYSNAGFTLLGYVVETATKRSLSSLAHEYIFDPLEMRETEYFLSAFESKAKTSSFDMQQIARPHSTYGNISTSMDHYGVAEWPACQLRSSLLDLTKYLTALTRNDSHAHQLLSPESKALMLPQTMTNGLAWWGKDTSYGDNSGRHWSHGGFMEGVRTHIYIWPGQENHPEIAKRFWKGAIILTNAEVDYAYITKALEGGLGI